MTLTGTITNDRPVWDSIMVSSTFFRITSDGTHWRAQRIVSDVVQDDLAGPIHTLPPMGLYGSIISVYV